MRLLISTDVPIGVIEELYRKLVFTGYEPEEIRINTNKGLIEIIHKSDVIIDFKKLEMLLEKEEVWSNIKTHILKIDNNYVTENSLNKLRKGILNKNIKLYSSGLGTAVVGVGMAVNSNPDWLSSLGTSEGKLNLASAGCMLLMAGYAYVLNWDRKQKERANR